ncbi:hypothetical protein MIMGU_mgv1a002257mg [Erythranthe guttata]|uniref:glucan endo-1,3-beta-D-glucosidase n=1 Tax=Erythranthe guttata TaxID=4155 RepID=A0A022RZ84_ERYGU|nr:hypothetical protein MIMGU_mgv1a002257mg [Erythranthe guttata]
MLKKIRRRVKTIFTKPFKQKPRRKPPPPTTTSPSPPTSPAMSPPPQTADRHHSRPFLFPQTHSTVLPDPSPFFSPNLTSAPLPTNSFFQNFVLKNGDQPEYIHPYLIKSSQSSLTLCYPSQFKSPAFIYQSFISDLTISNSNNPNPNANHVVSSFSDLGVTLDFPSGNLRFFLVRGSPFLTCSAINSVSLSISTVHAVIELIPNSSCTKYTIKLNNNQTWLLYASSPVNFTHDTKNITSSVFSGVIRIAALPNSDPKFDSVLDRFSSCYPVRGDAVFTKPFSLEYKWEKKGWGDLLMLAHPLHLRLLSDSDSDSINILEDFKYNSIDGDLGVQEESYYQVIEALIKDVEALNSSAISTSSSYFFGKLIARAARLALIAEEVCYTDVIPVIKKFLKETIEPWMNGTFGANGFLYDSKWGGIVTKQGSLDSGADFGFGVYNDHHYHLGYFIYGISVLAKIDAVWGRKYRPQAYSLMADFMNLSKSNYTRLRCFDLWKLHSWAGGLTEFADGRNQEKHKRGGERLLLGRFNGIGLRSTATSSLSDRLYPVKEGDKMYPEEFTRENRVVGVLWANKRDSGLWFAPKEWKECRLGIQLLPLLPISEALFSDVEFVRQLVEWTLPALGREGVGEGWKGFLYALQGVYDKEGALVNVGRLNGHDDGNSLTNLLWWIYSRDDQEVGCDRGGKFCWYSRHYSH